MSDHPLLFRLDYIAWMLANGETLAARRMLEAVISDLRSSDQDHPGETAQPTTRPAGTVTKG